MSKKIENLEELKDVKIPEESANEQPAPETPVPEQKKTLKDRFVEARKAKVTKKIEKEQKKIEKLNQKLNPVKKDPKIHIDKKKLLIGGAVGAAVLGSIGAACLRHAGQIEEEIPCEAENTPDCCEQTAEDPVVPEVQEEEA